MSREPTDRIAVGRKLLGEALQTRRTEAGLTRAEMSARTGLSVDTINSVERGRRLPSLEVLDLLATGLGTTAHLLLKDVFPWGRGEPPPPP